MCEVLHEKMHEQIIHGMVHDLYMSEPVVHVDNKARKRSGHMTHAMIELEPGKILNFNAKITEKHGRKQGKCHVSVFGNLLSKISSYKKLREMETGAFFS